MWLCAYVCVCACVCVCLALFLHPCAALCPSISHTLDSPNRAATQHATGEILQLLSQLQLEEHRVVGEDALPTSVPVDILKYRGYEELFLDDDDTVEVEEDNDLRQRESLHSKRIAALT